MIITRCNIGSIGISLAVKQNEMYLIRSGVGWYPKMHKVWHTAVLIVLSGVSRDLHCLRDLSSVAAALFPYSGEICERYASYAALVQLRNSL